MGKRRHGKPDRFGEGGGFSTDHEPIDDAALEAAIQGFVDGFVIKSKRRRALILLLGRPSKKIDTLQQLPEWIDGALQTELAGNTGFPQHLQERFGSLRGVLIDDEGARRMTIAGAVWSTQMSSGFGALFIADSGDIALLVPEFGPPTVCRRPSDPD